MRFPVYLSAASLIGGAVALWAKWLYVHPSNPSIGSALSLMADFVPMAIAVVGIVMSYRTPKPEHHLRTTLVLIACGFVGTGILSLARIRGEAAHKVEIDGLNGRLQSVADQNARILNGFSDTNKPATAPIPTPRTPPTEATRRKNVLALLRNQFILSHDNIRPALLDGTEQPPTEWINERLKQLGEAWTVANQHPLKIIGYDILPFAVDKKPEANVRVNNPGTATKVMAVYYQGIAVNLESNYEERKQLEELLWSTVEREINTHSYPMTIPATSNTALPIQGKEPLTQQQVDGLKDRLTFYVMVILLPQDGSPRIEGCIHSSPQGVSPYGLCISHND